MRPDIQATLSCTLSLGVPVLLALWELRNLRRGSGWGPEPIPDDERPRPPLPPCLLVPPRSPAPFIPAQPQRVLETVGDD
jgi:hypothetical protein